MYARRQPRRMAERRSRRAALRAVGAAGVAGLAGCFGSRGSDGGPPPSDATVRISPDPAFEPARLVVRVGDTVAWTNEGTRPQSVTAYEDEVPSLRAYFASGGFGREVTARVLYPLRGALRAGESYAHTFETAGEYGYFSIPTEAEGTTGTVVVEA